MRFPRFSFFLLCLFCAILLFAFTLLLTSTAPTDLPAKLASLSLFVLALAMTLEAPLLTRGVQQLGSGANTRDWIRSLLILVFLIFFLMLLERGERLMDFSEDGFHQLRQSSIRFLAQRKLSLTVFAMRNRDAELYGILERFLEVLQTHLPQASVRWIDPSTQPTQARESGIRTLPSILVQGEADTVLIGRSQLFGNMGKTARGRAFYGESALVEAVKSLENSQVVHLLFPELGKGPFLDLSAGGYSQFVQLLKSQGFLPSISETLPSTSEPTLVFLPPRKIPLPLSLELVKRIQSGAKTILFFEPSPHQPLGELSREMEWEYLGFPVVDPLRNAGNELSFLLPHFGSHPIAARLDNHFPVLLPGTSAFLSNSPRAQPILRSSSFSWAENPSGGSKNPVFNPESERKGPLDLALGIGENLVLLADQGFLSNEFLPHPGNQALILNSLYFLSGRLERASAYPKFISERPLQVPEQTRRNWIALILFLLPLSAWCIGGLLSFLRWREQYSSK
jgi:hypothetical protein